VYAVSPETVGGCRPQRLLPYVRAAGFDVVHHRVVQGDRSGVLGMMNSEVLVAVPGPAR